MTSREPRARLSDLIETSFAAERRGLRFYRRMARVFGHAVGAKEFFEDLARDEVSHIAKLEEIRAKLAPEQLDEEIEAKRLRRGAAVQEIIADPRIEAIRSLDDAYELTHDFEASELNRMFLFLSSQVVASEERHALLEDQILAHQNKVSRFGESPHDRAWRKSIQARRTGDP